MGGSEKRGYKEGQTVWFTAVMNEKATPVAMSLKSGMKEFTGRASTGEGLGDFVGTIKSFVHKANYGFIECPQLAEHGDVFLWGDEIRGYRPGQTVTFTAVMTDDGQPQARNLRSGLKN